jgi:flavin reductase (DIM6/NTAB) family NADH-FMN oxidoreductase RutF
MKKVKLAPKPWMFPKPAVLMGAMVKGKANFMTAANAGVIGYDPAMLYVASYKGHYTNAGVRREKCFSVNIASSKLAEKVDYCGLVSGRSHDKSKLFKLFFGETGAPLIDDCPVCFDCYLKRTMKFGEEDVFIGEIVGIWVDGKCLNKDGKPDIRKIDPLIYSTSNREYFRLGERIGPAYTIGEKLKGK